MVCRTKRTANKDLRGKQLNLKWGFIYLVFQVTGFTLYKTDNNTDYKATLKRNERRTILSKIQNIFSLFQCSTNFSVLRFLFFFLTLSVHSFTVLCQIGLGWRVITGKSSCNAKFSLAISYTCMSVGKKNLGVKVWTWRAKLKCTKSSSTQLSDTYNTKNLLFFFPKSK